MSIKVSDFELAEPAQPILLAEGQHALCLLVRFHGKPLGWVYLTDTVRGSVLPDAVSRAIVEQISWQCLEAVLGEGSPPHRYPSGKRPGICVIICANDESTGMSRCLSSLRAIKHPSDEIIVVDYGTRGVDRNLAANFTSVRYIRSEHSNIAVARNLGVAEAHHDLVAFIDTDSYPDPQWLDIVGDTFSFQPVDGMCGLVIATSLEAGPQMQFEQGGYGLGRGLERKLVSNTNLADSESLRARWFGSGNNMAFRRNAFRDIGGFDPRFDVNLQGGASDMELFHRFVVGGHRLLYEPRAITWYTTRHNQSSIRKTAYRHGKATGIYLLMCLRKKTVRPQAILQHIVYEWAWQRIVRRLVRPGKATRLLVLGELFGASASPMAFLKARSKFQSHMPLLNKPLLARSVTSKSSKLLAGEDVLQSQEPTFDHALAKRIKVVRTSYPHWGQFSGINQYLKYLDRSKFLINTLMVQESDAQFPLRSRACRDWIRYWTRKNDMAWYNLSDLVAEFSILKSCILERPHLVHYMDGEHAAQWIPRISRLPRSLRPIFVASYHQPPDVMASVIRKDIVAFFDRVIAVSPEQAEFLRGVTSPEKVALILHGVDTEFFCPPQQRPEREIVRCICAGYNYRDYRTVREVASTQTWNKYLEFHIVTTKVTGLEGLPNVVMHRNVDDQKLLSLYQDADILFLPLYKATANNSLLEGIACGLPVISTGLPSVKTYLPGKEALLIDANRVIDYVDALALLSKDRGLRQRMGGLARKRAEELSWGKVCTQYEEVYSELLNYSLA